MDHAGFYKTPERREKAIQTTESAISASDLAPSGGADTGQADSYILEINGSGETAVQARDIANHAADSLIIVSQQRFTQDSQAYAKALQTQLDLAKGNLATANQAVSDYEVGPRRVGARPAAGPERAGPGQPPVAGHHGPGRGAGRQGDGGLAAEDAEHDQPQHHLQPGHHHRSLDHRGGHHRGQPRLPGRPGSAGPAQADLAKDTATASSLQGQLTANPSTTLTQAQAGLLTLEQQVTADSNSVQSLSTAQQQALANMQASPIDLSRLGDANLPTYPTSPKRYLYLLLGLLHRWTGRHRPDLSGPPT